MQSALQIVGLAILLGPWAPVAQAGPRVLKKTATRQGYSSARVLAVALRDLRRYRISCSNSYSGRRALATYARRFFVRDAMARCKRIKYRDTKVYATVGWARIDSGRKCTFRVSVRSTCSQRYLYVTGLKITAVRHQQNTRIRSIFPRYTPPRTPLQRKRATQKLRKLCASSRLQTALRRYAYQRAMYKAKRLCARTRPGYNSPKRVLLTGTRWLLRSGPRWVGNRAYFICSRQYTFRFTCKYEPLG